VNLPGVPIPIPSLTAKDLGDLEFALGLGVDYVALSFVREAKDLLELREIIVQHDSPALVIAKIEKAEAVAVLDEVLDASDALMVARGDLGVEMGAATVPLLQKRIILRSLEVGKPVITATQMLESMIEHSEPTRAEASDVANAILDGTSALMLSGETAVGAHPIDAVRTMDQIARAVEPSMSYRHQAPVPSDERAIGVAMSNAACDIGETLGAKAIVVPTFSGKTASAVARLRPRLPIIGLSHRQSSVQQLALEWGVTPLPFAQAANVEDLWDSAVEVVLREGLVEGGDLVVLTAGTAVNMPGSTNMIKVEIA
jgi:pyruvate kinase